MAKGPEEPDISRLVNEWLSAVGAAFGERIYFAGLQGSFARGEAKPGSDVDLVLILDSFAAADAEAYRAAIAGLPWRELVCGFVSGVDELKSWPKSELFQFCLDTTPLRGSLEPFASSVSERDVLESALVCAGGVYHGAAHNLIHERDGELPAALCKTAFFALRAVHYLETGAALRTRRELAKARPELADIINGELSGSLAERSARLVNWAAGVLKTCGGLR